MNGALSFLDIANAVAVVAQAMTAALAAGRRRLDWFGVASLGCVTALGGGSIRDLVLGHYPLSWVAQPALRLLAAGAALATIISTTAAPSCQCRVSPSQAAPERAPTTGIIITDTVDATGGSERAR